MADQDDILKRYYERGVASYAREADLLFQCLNFFSRVYGVIILGLFLAAIFWSTNLLGQP